MSLGVGKCYESNWYWGFSSEASVLVPVFTNFGARQFMQFMQFLFLLLILASFLFIFIFWQTSRQGAQKEIVIAGQKDLLQVGI